jgi:hypothetical protein
MTKINYYINFKCDDNVILINLDSDDIYNIVEKIYDSNYVCYENLDGSQAYFTLAQMNGKNMISVLLSKKIKVTLIINLSSVFCSEISCHQYVDMEDFTFMISKGEYDIK